MQNMGMWDPLRIGTTVDASSDVQPTTPIRFELPEIIALAAGTASAGSPFVSNCWQLTWRPPMPPASLIDSEAAMQPARYRGPKLASAPEKGARTPSSSGPEPSPPPLEEVPPHAASSTRGATLQSSPGRFKRGRIRGLVFFTFAPRYETELDNRLSTILCTIR